MRVGIGYDVHKFVAGRKLILGGVDIPYQLGLLGHSDADVDVYKRQMRGWTEQRSRSQSPRREWLWLWTPKM